MKKSLFIISTIWFISCADSGIKKENNLVIPSKLMTVSFVEGQRNNNAGIIVAFTSDADSLWLKEEWVKSIKSKMKNLSSTYSTVLLYDDEKNMPNVSTKGMDYSLDYDRYMVCGYWKSLNGNEKFCYGGVKSDNNFKNCQ